jgi:hypothetical protein
VKSQQIYRYLLEQQMVGVYDLMHFTRCIESLKKTLAIISQEIIIASTKILEIPFLPDNMSVIINCSGILKLYNSEIKL